MVVKDIDQRSFGVEVLQRSHEVPVVVDFWAAWCGPCKVLGPVLERVAASHEGRLELVKVDVDQNPGLASQFGVQGIPTVIAFKGGRPAARFTGALPENEVRRWVSDILPTEIDGWVEQARDAVLDGDDLRAEALFRRVLDDLPDHPEAGTGLAALLIARGDTAEALILLGKLARSSEVERLEGAARLAAAQGGDLHVLEARLAADPDDHAARIELGRALAARQEHEPALDHLLAVVKAGGPEREAARQAMVDVFGVLGAAHPLTVTYRRALASALY
ncbi:MAG: putative Thioredoxin protein [Actinobacteria bacterium]|nr:putative Thioredoxin protein [Actinomycetota bacterium]